MLGWQSLSDQRPAKRFRCGYCGERVGSDKAYWAKGYRDSGDAYHETDVNDKIYICPNCTKPTYFTNDEQYPGSPFGNKVEGIPEAVEHLYNEARQCTTVQSYTAAVMVCRKILMNIAVDKGANEGINFIEYVDYLNGKNYIPPDGKDWVDQIRLKGNEANHEIVIMKKDDAEDLITFVEMLLKFIYEFPSKVKGREEQT